MVSFTFRSLYPAIDCMLSGRCENQTNLCTCRQSKPARRTHRQLTTLTELPQLIHISLRIVSMYSRVPMLSISTVRDHPLPYHYFDLSRFVPMNRYNITWLVYRLDLLARCCAGQSQLSSCYRYVRLTACLLRLRGCPAVASCISCFQKLSAFVINRVLCHLKLCDIFYYWYLVNNRHQPGITDSSCPTYI
jgi:hypothetical protein